jgi:hypothetical protein
MQQQHRVESIPRAGHQVSAIWLPPLMCRFAHRFSPFLNRRSAVMATDLGDKELKRLRNERWDKAFKVGSTEGTSSVAFESLNRKATIVIEHLIQASDVSHTMQHWDVYREWNENLFMEMYEAYRQGRVDRNPADFWFEGEMGFFDFYIVPLSQKLNDCGVFGISSDENLNYALENRKMWVSHGRRVVDELVKKAEAQ